MAGFNANVAHKQGGDSLTLGGRELRPVDYSWWDLRFALGADPNHIAYFDHMLGDTLRAEWVPTANNSGAIAANGGTGGTTRFTTGVTSTNYGTLTLGLHWLVSAGFTFFTARVASITAIATRTIEIGLTDATTETNGLIFSAHGTTTTPVADNAAIFAYDTSATPTLVNWGLFSVNATVPATRQVLSAAPVADTYQRFDIVIDPAGNAAYYINSSLVGTQALAVATTAILTPWVGVVTRTAGASIIDADYVGTVAGTTN